MTCQLLKGKPKKNKEKKEGRRKRMAEQKLIYNATISWRDCELRKRDVRKYW